MAGLFWEGQVEEALLELGWDNVPNREGLFVHRRQGLFLSVFVDDIKLGGKKQNMAPTWKKWMKNVDLDEPTSFLDHAFLGWTQRECKLNENIFGAFSKMFESRISAEATDIAWPCDMEGHAQKCVERCCELGNKKVEQ